MIGKYKDLLRYISETDASCTSDIVYSLELVRSSLETTLERIKKEINSANNNNSFEDVGQIAGYCKQITELDILLQAVVVTLLENEESKGAVEPENTDAAIAEAQSTLVFKSQDKAERVDYQLYNVDVNERHSLDEDFTYTKPNAIEINDHKMFVSSWKEAMVSVCNYLYELDGVKLRKLVGNKKLKGRKVDLLGYQEVPRRNVCIKGTNLYVWTNLNAALHVYYITQLLEAYEIPIENAGVYLNRDFTPLHKNK